MIVQAQTRAHSKPFSPSSFARAEACLRSVALTLEGNVGSHTNSFATLFGTVAHEVLAACISTGCTRAEVEAVVLEGEQTPVTDPMRAMVQMVLDYIAERLPGRALLSEIRVDSPWARLFGYVDICTRDAPLAVLDLKTGIEPPSWEQLGLYTLWLTLERERSIEGTGKALTTVIQPKAPQVIQERVWSRADLRALRTRLLALLDRIRRRDWGAYLDGP
jgi:hypothetical protein